MIKKRIFLPLVLVFLPFCNLIQARTENPTDSTVQTETSLTSKASWYNYKGGLYAASRVFKKGTVLRVVNLSNGKQIDVVVDDHGPSKKYSDRIIDLDREAFRRIAPLKKGLIKIIVYPLS